MSEMGRLGRSRATILAALVNGSPKSCREIMKETGLSRNQVYCALDRCWRRRLVLRTSRPIHAQERVFKGRGGLSHHTRPFHLYMLKPGGVDDVVVDGPWLLRNCESLTDRLKERLLNTYNSRDARTVLKEAHV